MNVELVPRAAPPTAPAAGTADGDRRERVRSESRVGSMCDGIVIAALLGAVLLVPITFFPYASAMFTVPKAMVLHSLAIVALSATTLKLLLGRPVELRRSPLDLPILAYLAVVMVGALLAESKGAAIFGPNERSDGLITLLSAIALFYVAYNLPSGRLLLRWGVTAVVAAAVISALEGIAQSLGFSLLGLYPQMVESRAYGTAGHPTFLGGMLVLAIPLSISLLVTGGRRDRPLWAFALGAMLLALFASYSRGAWLGTALALAVLLAVGWREIRGSWRWLLPPLAALLFFALTLEIGWLERSVSGPAAPKQNSVWQQPTGLDRLKGDTSGSGRLFIWGAAAEVVRDQPLLGSGYGNLYAAITRYLPVEHHLLQPGVWVDKVHNAYLDNAASLGIPGLLAYLWLMGSVARAIWSRLRRDDRGRGRVLVAALLAAWTGYLLHLFFLFETLDTLVVTWVLVALALREARRGTRPLVLRLRLPLAIAAPAALAILVAAVMALQWLAAPVVAEVHAQSASVAGQQGRMDEAAGELLNAAETNPYSTAHQMRAAAALAEMAITETDQRGARHLLDHSVRLVNRAIQADPEFASLYVLRGKLYTQYGSGERLGDALLDYRRATQLYPNYYEAHLGVAEVARAGGLLGEAIAAQRKLLELSPNDQQLLSAIAQDYSLAGRWRESIASWEQVIQAGGDGPGVRLAMAQTLVTAGQVDEGVAELDRAEAMDPGNENVAKMREALSNMGGN